MRPRPIVGVLLAAALALGLLVACAPTDAGSDEEPSGGSPPATTAPSSSGTPEPIDYGY